MAFNLHSVDMAYCTAQVSYIRPFLHFRNKSHLVLVLNLFNVLNSVSILLKICASMFITSLKFSYSVFGFGYHGNVGLIERIRTHSPLFNFGEKPEKDCYWLSLKYLVEFNNRAIGSRTFLWWEVFNY